MTRFSYQHITMHPFEEERGRRQRLPALEDHCGRPVPDFVRKSILLFFWCCWLLYQKKINIKKSTKKNQKTLQIASFEEKKKPVVDCKCFPVTQCNFLTFHLLSLSHISINLFKTQLEPLSLQLFLNVKIHLCSSCLFFLVIF